MKKNEEKYHRPVSSSVNKAKESERKEKEKQKQKTISYAQYKSKNRPQSGVNRQQF